MPSISLNLLRSDDSAGALNPEEIEHGMSSGQPSVALIVAALHRWAHTLGHVALAANDYDELIAAGQEAAAFLTAANSEVHRLRDALEEIAQRSHGVRSFEQSARLAGIHEYATAALDPTIERLIDGGAR